MTRIASELLASALLHPRAFGTSPGANATGPTSLIPSWRRSCRQEVWRLRSYSPREAQAHIPARHTGRVRVASRPHGWGIWRRLFSILCVGTRAARHRGRPDSLGPRLCTKLPRPRCGQGPSLASGRVVREHPHAVVLAGVNREVSGLATVPEAPAVAPWIQPAASEGITGGA